MENGSFAKVSARNQAKLEAEKAFRSGNFQDAVKYYQAISQNSYFTPPEVVLNQAHVLLLSKDTLQAQKMYAKLVDLEEPTMASTTYCQLGLLACTSHDTSKALILLKKSLKLNPENKIARYNFELLKQKYKPRIDPPKPQNNNNTVPPPPPTMDNREVAKDDAQNEMLKTLKNYGLTPEKAKMILDAMKNNEVQYIQQRNGLLKKNTATMKQNW